MNRILFILIVIKAMAMIVAAQNKSVYTNTRTGACRTISSDTNDAGSYEGECRGVGGYKLHVIEGDLRQTINVIDRSSKKHELKLWNISGGFSSVGPKAEWRMKGKTPVALIVRFNVSENPEDSSKLTSYLIVAKITKDKICVTAALKPTRSHNFEARKAADKSANRPCLTFN